MSTATNATRSAAMNIDSRVDAYPWSSVSEHLDAHGGRGQQATDHQRCEAVAGLYADDRHFRSHIVMARHGFGRGSQVFTYPLRHGGRSATALYPRWLRSPTGGTHQWGSLCVTRRARDFIARCTRAGQTRPTLLLQYGEGDFNALHQDCTANMSFRSRWRFCCRSRRKTSQAASSC